MKVRGWTERIERLEVQEFEVEELKGRGFGTEVREAAFAKSDQKTSRLSPGSPPVLPGQMRICHRSLISSSGQFLIGTSGELV